MTVFLFRFFFTCIFNSLCNFSHYKFERAIFIHSLSLTKKKKQQKDDHVILVNENRPGTIKKKKKKKAAKR